MLVLMTCTIAVSAPIMMVGGVIMALREDMGLGWILAVAVPALFVCVGFVVSRMVPSFRLMQGRIDEVNRVLREQITGIRVVRAFVREPYEKERFGQANDDLTDVSVTAGRWMATMFPLVILVVNVSSVAVIWFGGHRIDERRDDAGCADRLPVLPDADPDVGDDGDLHADDDPASVGLRGPDRGGARHRDLGAGP